MPPQKPELAPQKSKLSTRTEMPPTTTAEQDLHSASQRRINVIWELTQAVIAVSIVIANVLSAFFGTPTDAAATTTMTNAMFMVLGFYFGRTNHQKVGGVQLGR